MKCTTISFAGIAAASVSTLYFSLETFKNYLNKQIKWIKGEGEDIQQFFSHQSFAYPVLSFTAAYAGISAIAYQHLVKKLSEVEDKKILNGGKLFAFAATTLTSVGISEIITSLCCLQGQSPSSLVGEMKNSITQAYDGEWNGFSTLAQTALVLTGIFFISKTTIDKGIEKEKLIQNSKKA